MTPNQQAAALREVASALRLCADAIAVLAEPLEPPAPVAGWLTTRALARKAGCSVGTVIRAMDLGTIPFVRRGVPTRRVRSTDAEAWIAGRVPARR